MTVRRNETTVIRVGTSITLNRVLRTQLKLLRDRGWRVCAVCDEDEWTPALRELGIAHRALGMGRRPGPVALLIWGVRFWRLCRRERPAVVHTHNAFHGLAGRIAARLAGVPIVVQTVHNWYYLESSSGLRARLYVWLERLAARSCDLLLFINRDDVQRAATLRIAPAHKCHFIGNGIDTRALARSLETIDSADARRQLGLARTDAVLAMVARLEPPKDHFTLLDALPSVLERVPHLQVLLAGHGLRSPAVKTRAREVGVTEYVRFLGHRDDVPVILMAADAVVLSSSCEGFGRCLVEAMIAGRPVVGTDVVGIRDVISDGETGLLVPFGDAGALAQALIRVLTKQDGVPEMVRRAHSVATASFDERIVATRVDRVYTELLEAAGV